MKKLAETDLSLAEITEICWLFYVADTDKDLDRILEKEAPEQLANHKALVKFLALQMSLRTWGTP